MLLVLGTEWRAFRHGRKQARSTSYNGDTALIFQPTSGVTTRSTQDLASPLS